MENMGDNLKQLREDMQNWGNPTWQENEEREYQAIQDELMPEAPLSVPTVTEPTPAVNTSLPVFISPTPVSQPVLTPTTSTPVFEFPENEL